MKSHFIKCSQIFKSEDGIKKPVYISVPEITGIMSLHEKDETSGYYSRIFVKCYIDKAPSFYNVCETPVEVHQLIIKT